MAIHASAIKAARQAVKRNERNRASRSELRTTVANFRKMVAEKKDKKTLQEQLNEVQSALMRAAHRKIIKKETASRQISRLSQLI